ncbi:hypothetical protein EDD40_7920 [Saccharothrix texasensis]|uniref:Uncharacterized protein n=2 Tax=Saccharothrix texasensis TaxID=103734 RepID=A0A3N1HIU4_9PSEU|nr:hypothetical protein EDD40_7920 [Saccharothrix texasensis]
MSDTGLVPRLARARSGYRDGMEPKVLKKSLAVLVSGAALFLSLGAGCESGGDGDGDEDRPGVEQQDQQDGDQGDEQDGEQDGDN